MGRGWIKAALEDEAEDDHRDDNDDVDDDGEEEGWVGGKKRGGGESLRLLGGWWRGGRASKRGIQSSERMMEGVFGWRAKGGGEGRPPAVYSNRA